MDDKDIKTLCRQRGLTFISTLSRNGRGSQFVAKVEIGSGQPAILKQGRGERPGETCALRAWQETNAAAHMLDDYEDGTFLIDWMDGPQLGAAMPQPSDTFHAIGRMLHDLHAVSPPACLQEMGLAVALADTMPGLTVHQRAILSESIQRINDLAASEPVVLHGDIGMLNILLTSAGPKVIDPAGLRGPAAMDVAQLAVVCFGRTGARCLRDLLDGYGGEPSGLFQARVFLVLLYLTQARSGHDWEMLARLAAVANEIAHDEGSLRAALGL